MYENFSIQNLQSNRQEVSFLQIWSLSFRDVNIGFFGKPVIGFRKPV